MSPFIICPGGRASDLLPADRCAASNLQRIQIDLVNWPWLTTSGIDTHLPKGRRIKLALTYRFGG